MIPGRHFFVRELKTLAYRWWEVDNQHVGPFDEPLENFFRAGRFEIDRESTLVTIVEMPRVVLARARVRRCPVGMPVGIAKSGRLDFDDVRAEVGQHGRCAGTRDEAGEVDNSQAGKNVVVRHNTPLHAGFDCPYCQTLLSLAHSSYRLRPTLTRTRSSR